MPKKNQKSKLSFGSSKDIAPTKDILMRQVVSDALASLNSKKMGSYDREELTGAITSKVMEEIALTNAMLPKGINWTNIQRLPYCLLASIMFWRDGDRFYAVPTGNDDKPYRLYVYDPDTDEYSGSISDFDNLIRQYDFAIGVQRRNQTRALLGFWAANAGKIYTLDDDD